MAAATTDELICEPCDPPEEAEEGAAEDDEDFFEEPTTCGLWGCVLSRTHSGLCEVPAMAKRGSRKPQVYDAEPGKELNKQILARLAFVFKRSF